MNKMQLGIAAETQYGTPVVVTRFLEFLPGESLMRNQQVINSSGLRPGLRSKLGPRRKLVRKAGAGNVSFEVATTNFGLLFEHMLGTTAKFTDSTGVYTHTATPGSLLNKSLTIQKGVEKTDETVSAFTFHGSKVTDWEFSVSRDNFLVLDIGFDSEDVDTTTALAVASMPVYNGFMFAQGSLEIDDVVVAGVSDVACRGTNPLDTERYFLAGTALKEQPLENDFREYGGALNMEFRSLASFYDAFAADTAKKLELIFTGPIITGTWTSQLVITFNDIRFTGETPKIAGPAPAAQNVPFEGFETEAGASVSIALRTAEATP